MRIIGQSEAFLYNKKGYNANMIENGVSINVNEMYEYLKRNHKTTDSLTRQEYLMFKNNNKY